jgi:hypothetical protein
MSTRETVTAGKSEGRAVSPLVAILAWLWVLIPFGYGLVQLLSRIPALFGRGSRACGERKR